MDGTPLTHYHRGRWYLTRAIGTGPFAPSYSLLDLPSTPGATSLQMREAILHAVWTDVGSPQVRTPESALQHAAMAARRAIEGGQQ